MKEQEDRRKALSDSSWNHIPLTEGSQLVVDTDTFLTTLFVMVDDFCQSSLPPGRAPGPDASLTRSEVVTLAVFSQWHAFQSERGFFRWAQRHLRSAFPRLPARSQFNRLVRKHQEAIVSFFLHGVRALDGDRCAYEALDSCAVPVRNIKRRGDGWLAGLVNRGWSNRLGWYEGFHLLVSVNPEGVITGFGFGQASVSDQPLAETFFERRHDPRAALRTVGSPARGPYVTDKGFEGQENHSRWWEQYGARVICPPRRNGPIRRSPHSWSKELRRWQASLRQIVETAISKLVAHFRLDQDRPHDLCGFRARLVARMALHNFCISLNRQLGRPSLAFADLWDW